jgi:hypothetical protein
LPHHLITINYIKKFDAHPQVLETYQILPINLLLALKKVGKSIEDKTKYTAKHNL